MMTRTLSAVAKTVHGRLIGADSSFATVSTDTRVLKRGALFVALSGPNFDGNDFVSSALSRGAAGAMVSRPADIALPQIAVSDTLKSLGALARSWRENFAIPVVAVTGSVGKTTVKELIAAIIAVEQRVCVTEGNMNNEIGVPLTLLRLDRDHDALVVELGANHANEISRLSAIALPTVGVITAAGAAHLEGFGSIEGVAAAKGELLDHLPRAGTAVLNADDRFFGEWRSRSRAGSVVSFGFSERANCRVIGRPDYFEDGARFKLSLPDQVAEIDVELPLLGEHNVRNALAAAAAAHALGIAAEQIREGLSRAATMPGRLRMLRGRGNARLIDDSYNANPSSVRAALDYLQTVDAHRIFVFGDMGELGASDRQLHAEIGEYAAGRCETLICVGSLAAEAARSFDREAIVCADINAAESALAPRLGPTTVVLIKASRAAHLERLVARLAGSAEEVGC